ncbi:MAG: class I SAM-dependent methyltransferase [Acidobacteria bacterium]|nr:class I SAM-dependent methyltransferase [Acidobacteriota bacterium]
MDEQLSVDLIRDHYDRVSVFYRALWGDHIHHGYWEGGESPAAAQVKLVERLAERASIPRASRVLDVGCGVGGSSLWLARKYDCSVLGLTISPVQAAMATEMADAEGLSESMRFEVSDANHLDLGPESFDAVWVVECSEHLADKARFIECCARSLKPGGVLALCAWLSADDPASTSHEQIVRDVCRGMLCPSLASMSDYTGWMRASGFERIEAEDITMHVRETWTRCAALARRKEVKALLKVSDARTRRFVESISAIKQAYDVGAMAYGMFTARKFGR